MNLKFKFYAVSIICLVYSTALAGSAGFVLPNGNILRSEEDCIALVKLQNTWTIDFAERIRDMEKSGKLVRYPHKLPVEIIGEKVHEKRYKCYQVSIFNGSAKQSEIVWTDRVQLE
jgi:hypothetical protein